jgi:hypothetical protein
LLPLGERQLPRLCPWNSKCSSDSGRPSSAHVGEPCRRCCNTFSMTPRCVVPDTWGDLRIPFLVVRSESGLTKHQTSILLFAVVCTRGPCRLAPNKRGPVTSVIPITANRTYQNQRSLTGSSAELICRGQSSSCLSGCPTREGLLGQINSRIRLVRLRPEFAHLYPGLEPGVWETASEIAARLLAQHALQPSPGFMLSNRILPDEHFEFQGGIPGGLWNGRRTRLTD